MSTLTALRAEIATLRRVVAALETTMTRERFDWFRPLTPYIVFRAAPGMPAGWMPNRLEGLWIDRPTRHYAVGMGAAAATATTATATGRYERRDDGMLAEVYEVGPPDGAP